MEKRTIDDTLKSKARAAVEGGDQPGTSRKSSEGEDSREEQAGQDRDMDRAYKVERQLSRCPNHLEYGGTCDYQAIKTNQDITSTLRAKATNKLRCHLMYDPRCRIDVRDVDAFMQGRASMLSHAKSVLVGGRKLFRLSADEHQLFKCPLAECGEDFLSQEFAHRGDKQTAKQKLEAHLAENPSHLLTQSDYHEVRKLFYFTCVKSCLFSEVASLRNRYVCKAETVEEKIGEKIGESYKEESCC